jgi:nucleotide-binding universal stress UspA family protein
MRILAVLIQPYNAEPVLEEVRAAAEGNSPVTILQLYDAQLADRVSRKLTQDGWLGSKHSEGVAQALTEDTLNQTRDSSEIWQKQLVDQGLDVRCVTRSGDLVNSVLRVADEEGDVGLIIVGQPHHNWMTRWFKDFNYRLLVERACCEVRRIDQPS